MLLNYLGWIQSYTESVLVFLAILSISVAVVSSMHEKIHTKWFAFGVGAFLFFIEEVTFLRNIREYHAVILASVIVFILVSIVEWIRSKS